MATNPRTPDDPRRPQIVERDVHPKIQQQLQPQSKIPWPLIAIVVAALILAALVIWLPRTPRATSPSGAQVPAQPTGSQVQFTNLKLTPATIGGSLYIDARLVNAGPTAINGVLVDATFKGANGQDLETIRRPVQGLAGGSNVETEDLTKAPIKPTEARPVRISFDRVPDGWNHQMPALTVAAVTAIGQGGDKLAPPIVNKDSSSNPRSPGAAGQGGQPQR